MVPRETATRGAVPVCEPPVVAPDAAAPAEAAAPEPERAPDEPADAAPEPEPEPEPAEAPARGEAEAAADPAPAVGEAAEPEPPAVPAWVTTGRREVGAGPVWARSPMSPVAATPPPVAVRVGAL